MQAINMLEHEKYCDIKNRKLLNKIRSTYLTTHMTPYLRETQHLAIF